MILRHASVPRNAIWRFAEALSVPKGEHGRPANIQFTSPANLT